MKTANYKFGRVDQKDSRLNFLPYKKYTSDHIDLMSKNVIPILSIQSKEGENTIIFFMMKFLNHKQEFILILKESFIKSKTSGKVNFD